MNTHESLFLRSLGVIPKTNTGQPPFRPASRRGNSFPMCVVLGTPAAHFFSLTSLLKLNQLIVGGVIDFIISGVISFVILCVVFMSLSQTFSSLFVISSPPQVSSVRDSSQLSHHNKLVPDQFHHTTSIYFGGSYSQMVRRVPCTVQVPGSSPGGN